MKRHDGAVQMQGEATIHVVWPDGHQQDVQVAVWPKFAGVAGVHLAPTQTQHNAIAHPTSNNRPAR